MNVREYLKAKPILDKGEIKSLPFDTFQNGVYAYHQGPSLGSLAEYKMLNLLGADLVGMSMLPEYCYLKSVGIQAHFLSIPVCNYYPFEEAAEPSYEEVLKISSASVPVLVEFIKSYLTHPKLE
jgi:purine-nucleoside phosphorylase